MFKLEFGVSFSHCVFLEDNTALHWSSHNTTNITVTVPFPPLSSLTKNNWPTTQQRAGANCSALKFPSGSLLPGLKQLLLTLKVIYHSRFFLGGCWVPINQRRLLVWLEIWNFRLCLAGWGWSTNQEMKTKLVMLGAVPKQQEWPGGSGTHRGQSLQRCKPLVPGGRGFLERFVPLDQLLHLIHALPNLTAGQVGLLAQQPGLSHTCISGELVHLQNWAERAKVSVPLMSQTRTSWQLWDLSKPSSGNKVHALG